MAAGDAEHDENVRGHADVRPVHPVVHQHIADDIDIGAVAEPVAHFGHGFGHRNVLLFAFSHGFAVRGGVDDGEIVDFVGVRPAEAEGDGLAWFGDHSCGTPMEMPGQYARSGCPAGPIIA